MNKHYPPYKRVMIFFFFEFLHNNYALNPKKKKKTTSNEIIKLIIILKIIYVDIHVLGLIIEYSIDKFDAQNNYLLGKMISFY